MNERIQELGKQALDYANGCEAEAWDGAYERKFVELIIEEVLLALSDLKGYSGVGTDGDPYCTMSWNAALAAAKELIVSRIAETRLLYTN